MMVVLRPMYNEIGTYYPFPFTSFHKLNVLRNAYEHTPWHSDMPVIRELRLNGKRIWLHPNITDGSEKFLY